MSIYTEPDEITTEPEPVVTPPRAGETCPTCGHRAPTPRASSRPRAVKAPSSLVVLDLERSITPTAESADLHAAWLASLDNREAHGMPRYPKAPLRGATAHGKACYRWGHSRAVAPWRWALVSAFYAGRVSSFYVDEPGTWAITWTRADGIDVRETVDHDRLVATLPAIADRWATEQAVAA